jgi:hypothetical protein
MRSLVSTCGSIMGTLAVLQNTDTLLMHLYHNHNVKRFYFFFKTRKRAQREMFAHLLHIIKFSSRMHILCWF